MVLDEFPFRNCSKPGKQRYITEELPCAKCPKKAYSNATNFIKDTVLPQLSNLKFQTRGINGFVIPPRDDLRPVPEIVGTKLGQGMEKNRRRRVKTAGTNNTTVSSNFLKIVLNHSIIATCRLINYDVAEPNINIRIEVRNSTADTD